MVKLLAGLTVLTSWGFTLWGFGIHFYTMYLSWLVGGFLGAIIAFFTPFLAEIYWIYRTSVEYGIVNLYNFLIVGLFLFRIVMVIILSVINTLLEKRGYDIEV